MRYKKRRYFTVGKTMVICAYCNGFKLVRDHGKPELCPVCNGRGRVKRVEE